MGAAGEAAGSPAPAPAAGGGGKAAAFQVTGPPGQLPADLKADLETGRLDHLGGDAPIPDDDAVQLMDPIEEDRKLQLVFEHVSAFVLTALGPPSMLASLRAKLHRPTHDSSKKAMRQILYDLTGSCHPGEVLALMGPSGSGKTTLLSIAGGRTPALVKMEGQVLFNGVALTKRAKRKVGFVLQDDLLYESLTVFETLHYAAQLRLPREMSQAAKLERVNVVLTALGLNKCRDTIIGGFFRRGISGGERKRVSVGHELLINPSILLLDEPTSGLDSTTAMHLVATLRQLARGGRAVVTTIHQPSSRLYLQLDKLLLLSEGHPLYYGGAALVAEWFHKLGYTLPYGINAADFILDLACGDVLTRRRPGEEGRTHLIACAEHFLRAHPGGYQAGSQLSEAELGGSLWAEVVATTTSPRKAPELYSVELQRGSDGASSGASSSQRSSGEANALAADVEAAAGRGSRPGHGSLAKGERRWGASYPRQLYVLFSRAVKTRRFETLSTQDLAQFLILGVLTGLFWWQVSRRDTVVAARNTIGLLFFEMLFLSFRSMFSALFTFPNEFKMMLKERASGMYRLSAFYFARTASDLPMDCSIPTLFIVLLYFMSGLRLTAGAFVSNWLAVMLVMLVAQSFGLLVGATVMVPKTAQTITAVLMLTMMLVGGYYVTNIPVWIAWVKYLSFIYYGYNLLLKIEYGDRTIYDCGGANPPNPAALPATCTPVSSLQSALTLPIDVNEWPWEVPVMLGWLLVFRAAVYVALRVKTGKV